MMRPSKKTISELKKRGVLPEEIVPHPERVETPARLNSKGGADQSAAAETDINNIIQQYKSTGELPAVMRSQPLQGGFTEAFDLQQALDRTLLARESYLALSSAVRAASGNDPVLFLEMVSDAEGRAILEHAGLEIADSESAPPDVREENTSPPEPPRESAAPAQPPAEGGEQNPSST